MLEEDKVKDSNEIQELFEDLVKFFETNPKYKVDWGGKYILHFNEPKIKMFVRDIKGIDDQPYICIRHWG